MIVIEKTAIVPYADQQMFELVNDIESYSEYLPWCKQSVVHTRNDESVLASLTVEKGPLKQTFTTLNKLSGYQRIDLSLKEGAFKYLQGHWSFVKKQDNWSQINFRLEFEFSNKLVDKMLGPVFGSLTGSLMDAFCQEAKVRYG